MLRIMAHDVILTGHIAVGVAGVCLGPLAIAQLARGRAGWLALAYHLAVAMVCASAIGLAALDFAGLWWFVLVAAGSYAFAVRAQVAIHRGGSGWQARAVRGFGGAYIALWTAIVVVSVPGIPVLWAVPALVGIPALEWFTHRIGAELRSGAAGPVAV